MPRTITDNSTSVKASIALPNAANTVNTASIDLGSATPFPITEEIGVKVSTTAATGANNLNVTLVVQDSADDSSWANIATLGATVINEGSSAYAATTANYQLPPDTRRYVRASATGEANGGNAADGTLTIQLVF